MENKSTYRSFMDSRYFSIKHTNYFDVYDQLLAKFVGETITFVEIGILDGGSLFMWRDFLGKNARIIGVDLNPEATKWREHGFEIFIGDQSNSLFWSDFFKEIGDIHVLLDDGGHRNDQQIITTRCALPHILDGGLIIIEDTQTSFMKFENFQKYSFVNFLKDKINSLNARSDELNIKKDIFSSSVHSIEFFAGICVLHVNRSLSTSTQRIENDGSRNNATDFRYTSDGAMQSFLRASYDWISWDYLSDNRIKKYPRTSKFLQVRLVRGIVRLVIIPIRFANYLFLQLFNLYNLKKLMRQLKNR
ncbi:MAG: class I SAM-dependent methyltransferase [Candidatus Planktophila sp.]|nr:class I SAM-dependent methyltransferase [Candidatus Planktophila sp.]